METTALLTVHTDRWRSAADRLLLRSAPAAAAGVLASDADDEAAAFEAAEIEADADELLAHADAILAETSSALVGDADATARTSAIALGTLEIAGQLLGTEDDGGVLAADAPAGPDLDLITATVLGRAGNGPAADGGTLADDAVPKPVTEQLDEIELAAGKELWELAKNEIIRFALGEFVDGLEAVLTGGAKAAFDAVRSQLSRIRDTLKRVATKIIEWFTERLSSWLPDAAMETLKKTMADQAKKFTGSVPAHIGSGLGWAFGRSEVEKAWDLAEGAPGHADALKLVESATDDQLQRIGWVTKGRKALDSFAGKVLRALVDVGKQLAPPFKLAYFAAVAAIAMFIGFQLWDGMWDMEKFAPDPA